jgi:hypothetical protein
VLGAQGLGQFLHRGLFLGRDPVTPAQPAGQIDIGAAGRTERPMGGGDGFAADRTGAALGQRFDGGGRHGGQSEEAGRENQDSTVRRGDRPALAPFQAPLPSNGGECRFDLFRRQGKGRRGRLARRIDLGGMADLANFGSAGCVLDKDPATAQQGDEQGIGALFAPELGAADTQCAGRRLDPQGLAPQPGDAAGGRAGHAAGQFQHYNPPEFSGGL